MAIESRTSNYLDKVIERGIIFLLVFTPLAFGTVQPWSIAVMELAAFFVFGAWLLNHIRENTGTVKAPILYMAAATIFLIMLQLVPMPRSVLSSLSPSTVSLYDQFSGTGKTGWAAISIHPDATREELYKILAYAAVFIVIIHHYRKREQLTPVLHTVVFMGCFLAMFAVAQKLTWNGKLYWIFPVGVSSSRDYIWGPYINHNHFAGYLEMAIPVSLGLLLHHWSKVSTSSRESFSRKILVLTEKKESSKLAVFIVAVIVMTGALFLSLSRGAAIGFFASMLLFTAMTRARRSMQKKMRLLFLIGFAVFTTAVAANWEHIENRFSDLSEKGKILRSNVWADSIGIARDFPVMGTGFGTFRNIYPRYQTNYPNVLFEHAENDYLEVLTDNGIAGFALALGIAATFFIKVLNLWKARHREFVVAMGAGGLCSCAAIAVHGAVDFNLRIPANALTLTVIAAVTFAVVHARNEEAKTPDRHTQKTAEGMNAIH